MVANPEVTIQRPLAETTEIEGAKSQNLAQKIGVFRQSP